MEKKDLKNVLKIVAVLAIGAVIAKTFFPAENKTNSDYLEELIAEKMFEKTAEKLVDQLKLQNPALDEQRLLQTRALVSECLSSKAQIYLASSDPYLQAPANNETPTVLASRFMKECDLL